MAEIELPEDEKSQTWRQAILFYSLGAPLVLASPVMYMIFSQSMFKGEVCKFYELAGNLQTDCLAGYDDNESFYKEASGFRYIAFIISLIAPIVFLFIELSLN